MAYMHLTAGKKKLAIFHYKSKQLNRARRTTNKHKQQSTTERNEEKVLCEFITEP